MNKIYSENKSEYIYLLQEREFIKTNENIFKIGKTKQANNKRFSNYPNGSILLFQMICNNCDILEKQIIRTLKCLHCFDLECIDNWLINNKKCPTCKFEI